jgi:hypothetical protein
VEQVNLLPNTGAKSFAAGSYDVSLALFKLKITVFLFSDMIWILFSDMHVFHQL